MSDRLRFPLPVDAGQGLTRTVLPGQLHLARSSAARARTVQLFGQDWVRHATRRLTQTVLTGQLHLARSSKARARAVQLFGHDWAAGLSAFSQSLLSLSKRLHRGKHVLRVRRRGEHVSRVCASSDTRRGAV